MDGVLAEDPDKDIKIENGEEKGTQKVTFKSTNPDLTKEKAIAAIGEQKDRFVVTKVTKAPADETEKGDSGS
ncbi:hypothetical protein BH23VER1_BH23VER1_00450 [soil metagenome]